MSLFWASTDSVETHCNKSVHDRGYARCLNDKAVLQSTAIFHILTDFDKRSATYTQVPPQTGPRCFTGLGAKSAAHPSISTATSCSDSQVSTKQYKSALLSNNHLTVSSCFCIPPLIFWEWQRGGLTDPILSARHKPVVPPIPGPC